RGLRIAKFHQRAGGAGNVSDPCLWQRRTKREVAAEARGWRGHWLFWVDGAGVRFQSQRDEDNGGEAGVRMGSEWGEDLDYKWLDCRCCRGLGPNVRWNSGISSGARDSRILRSRHSRKDVDAGIRHVEPHILGLPDSRGEPAS